MTIIPLWLKPINRFNATKVAIDLSPCLKPLAQVSFFGQRSPQR
ncbi:hypothetical protein [Anabaena sp. CS-542/02]|nr:hypothetical protein [Anabaena sp. CS-542/02]